MTSSFFEKYPVSCVYNNRKIILIWQTSDQVSDTFRLSEMNRLLFANSEEELIQLLEPAEIKETQWKESTEINISKFLAQLSRLKTKHSSSKITCKQLVDGWNFIEDILRTFHLDKESKKLKSPILNKVYKKLFYGCNLPSVTPEGESYSPIWTNEEIFLVRKEFRDIWSFLKKEKYVPF
ncbi:hypothetical protein BegalDRAFT_0404 [Beggiatoa alba B18LD]|uniref:Uncharacterized protein n=1 Tax=Beggiatoa alba B18LD TaxID=395493 RepID=I3CCI1_9GAMM|nr:hypothetical protein [Beggiatoa alba]EIJ41324.1 hypothetical protein BegalDRAFT_0404 [Beggiatoa alba B18LD]